MKKSIFIFCFLSIASGTIAQQWNWAKNIDNGNQELGTSIGADKLNNLYVIGSTSYYTGGGGSFYYPLIYKFNSAGNLLWTDTLAFPCEKSVTDSFGNTYITYGSNIAKYDSAGQKLWQKYVPNMFFKNIALNFLGGFIVIGSTQIPNYSGIVYGYDQNGNYLWSQTGIFTGIPCTIVCDQSGNSYIGGDTYTDSLTGNGGFLAKLDSTGNLIYYKSIPQTISDLTLDKNNNIYVCGAFSAIPIHINGITYSANQTPDQFLIKYDNQGSILWYKIITGYLTMNAAIAIDANDNVFFTSSYLNLNVESYCLNSNSEEVFVLMADSAGNIQWIEHSTGSTNQDAAYTRDILVTSQNAAIIVGAASGNHSFGSTIINPYPYPDLLVAQINTNSISSVPFFAANSAQLTIYPNPASDIFTVCYSSSEKNSLLVNITNAKGQIIYTETVLKFEGEYKKQIDLSKEAKGIYFVEIITDNKKTVKRIAAE